MLKIPSGVCIALIWAIYQCHVFTDLITIEWSTYMPLGVIAFDDFVIASSLCYLIATSRTGFPSTDSFLTKLMAYTINTGCLTSVTSMLTMITCAVMPRNFIFLAIEFLIAKLYVNSYLALLNARYYLQPDTDTINPAGYHIHRGAHHPELHVNVSQDETSSPNVFKRHDEEALCPTRPVQAVMVGICVTVNEKGLNDAL
ncbi:hypothetical protein K503DRAFT_615365 [Rhizopogon vinicolor AM-OR11-026]|uniref:DUF6534 domain-containing protein n=1 Tax=Rhizopogon vinicolor AM-OR11-026 TaxID=1314800 RepID=A0A1B7MIG0_9AGAM|nr:hypothetical protein K503DRAFT_615365 [Rhizopogon vinicolor AM-OR11-026]